MKKIISILIAVITMLSALCIPVSAYDKGSFLPSLPKEDKDPVVYYADAGAYGDRYLTIRTLNMKNAPKNLGADGYYVSVYKNKKWEKLFFQKGLTNSDLYCVSGLKPDTEYKFRITLYKNVNGKAKTLDKYENGLCTLKEKPYIKSVVKKNNKITIKIDSYSKWDEYYVYTTRYLKGFKAAQDKFINQGQNVDLLKYIKSKDFTTDGENTISFNVGADDEDFTFSIWASRVDKDGNKVSSKEMTYDDYVHSRDMEKALGKAAKTKSAADNKIISKIIKRCVRDDLTAEDNAYNIFCYVHLNAAYEYDGSKIDKDPIQAVFVKGKAQCLQWASAYRIIMQCYGFKDITVVGGTKSGTSHWWCELKVNGQTYIIDPYPNVYTFLDDYHNWFYYEGHGTWSPYVKS